MQFGDALGEPCPHLALHLVHHARQATLDLEADLVDQLGQERASLLPPVGEPPSPLVQYLLAAVDRRDAEHGGPDDRRTEQGSHQSEQLDSRLGTGHEAVARSEA